MKTLLFLMVGAFIVSCTSVQKIGDLNMISNRNVDSHGNYILIKNYVGGSKKELKKSRYTSMEDALDAVVRTTPGGEFLKNTKIYLIKKGEKKIYFAVEGDIWGLGEQSYQGFKSGNIVQWKDLKGAHRGKIMSLKNDKVAAIQEDGNDTIKEIEYSELLKLNE